MSIKLKVYVDESTTDLNNILVLQPWSDEHASGVVFKPLHTHLMSQGCH